MCTETLLMDAEYIVRQISPMLAVADMKETIGFYADVLGFQVYVETEEYSIIERNGFAIHLLRAADESVLAAVRGHMEIYMEVSGIGPLWQHVQTYRDKYKVRDLFEREYGMTEFHIEDPNRCLVFVGERTASLKQ
jgi:catechol 2,3-dioxygenase-like lactoylglutathione lyase family enzyme